MTQSNSRWLGLKPYEEKDAHIFFGREKESEQFYRMITRETLTTIFAPSGTGKTSLLRAGVFPKLRQHGFFPIWLRLDHNTSGTNHSQWLRQHLEEAVKNNDLDIDTVVPALVSEEKETLWEYLHRIELWDKNNQLITPVIVLDQFEEIFAVGKDRPESKRFLQDLADLVEKRMPQSLRRNLSRKGELTNIPTETQGFKIILSLREDFVAHLDDLRKSMPSIMHNRYSLRSLNGEQAYQVVLKVGKGIVEEKVARKIVQIVAKAGEDSNYKDGDLSKLTVEANLLSLVCHELNQQRIREALDFITVKGLENASTNILRRFYQESFTELDKSARIFVENKLLTKTGFRNSQPLDDIPNSELSEEARTHLIDRHVLRQVDRKDIPHIELTHDLLTEVIKESRDLRHEQEENEEHLRIRQEQRKKIHRFTAVTIALICMLVFTLFSFHAEKEAKKTAVNAVASSENMLNFMTKDLYDRLLPIGRLDLLEDVASKAQKFFDENSFVENNRENLIKQSLVRNKIANVLVRRRDINGAIKTHKKAIELMTKAKRINQGDLSDEENGDLVKMEIDYATVLKDWGKPKDAKELLSKLKLINLTSSPENDLLGYQIELLLIQTHHQLGYYQEVLDKSKKLLGLVPNNIQGKALIAELYRTRAQAHAGLGVFSNAFIDIRNGLKIINGLSQDDPENDEWKYRKALVLHELGVFHLAIQDFEGAKDKLEPTLAIALKKMDYSKKQQQEIEVIPSPEVIHSQWSYLAASLSIDLSRLWLKEVGLPSNSDESNQAALDSADRYLQMAYSIVVPAKKEPTTLPQELIYAEVLVLSNHLQIKKRGMESAKRKPNLDNSRKGLENRLKHYQKDILKETNQPIIALSQTLVLKSIVKSKEQKNYYTNTPIPKEIERGINILEKTISDNPKHQIVRGQLADFYTLLANENKIRGIFPNTVNALRKALEHRSEAVSRSSIQNLTLRRAEAKIKQHLADELSSSESTEEALEEAVDLYEQAYQLWSSLLPLPDSDFLRVEDRINSARALYKKGKILKNEAAQTEFKRASNLGLKEATLELTSAHNNRGPKENKRLRDLAKKQTRKIFLLPTLFLDELEGDGEMTISRRINTEVTLTNPIQSEKKGQSSKTIISEEEKRLKIDLMLYIDPLVKNEINQFNNKIDDATTLKHELLLGENIDYVFTSPLQGESNKLTRNLLVTLQSPVLNKYPKTAPTVIGNECWLRWSYIGTAEDQSNFKLQVSSSNQDFTSNLMLDKKIKGTSFRYDCLKGNTEEKLNHELYWRVRHISGLQNGKKESRGNEWSLIQKLKVYNSVWERIICTGELRIGISDFEGDLLQLDETNPNKLAGFDGRVLELIKDELNKERNKERNKLKTKFKHCLPSDYKELVSEPIVYGWNGMFEAVSRNEVDLAISTITRTHERENRFGIKFSEPYFETKLVIFYNKKGNGGESVKSMEALKKSRIVAIEGFRGAEVGELIVGNNLERRSYTNRKILLGQVSSEKDSLLAITDYVYLHEQFSNTVGLEKILGYHMLTHSDYEKLIELENKHETKRKLQSLQKDYGTAEWEQYAVATSARGNGELLKIVNNAILKMRKNGELRKISKDEGLTIPERLIGSEQVLEEIRHLASVFPIFPTNGHGTKRGNIRLPVVMGEKIKFSWTPLGINRNSHKYRIQVASSPDFSSSKILWNKTTLETSYTIKPTAPKFQGKLFWRAKLQNSSSEKDDFPQDGWSNPVAFEYYKNSMARIKTTRKLLVGVTVSNGFSIYERDHMLVGFDMDIVNYLAGSITESIKSSEKPEKLIIETIPMNFPDMFPMIKSYQIDFAISGITSTPEREEDYEIKFSTPYAKTKQAAIWVEDPSIHSIQDLFGKSFIVFKDTRAEEMAKLFSKEKQITTTLDNPKAYLLNKLTEKHAVATITDYPTAMKLVEEYNNGSSKVNFKVEVINIDDFDKLKTVTKSQFDDFYAIPIQKDQKELIVLVNKGIEKLRSEHLDKLKNFFETHQKFDESRYLEEPFKFEW